MPEKHTLEFIRLKFEEEGYTLLSQTYKNSTTKLEYACNNGHIHSIRWGDFQQGHRCYTCRGTHRLTYTYVKQRFEEAGCILLSTSYKNSYSKLDYICKNGHEHSIRWDDFRKGFGCPICADKNAPKGEDHWNWQGGLSAQPYCPLWLDKEYKNNIKDRDNNICQNPYCYKTNYKGRTLSIHHINYNKKDCSPGNLITLCVGCNNRANKDRVWHTAWYQILMTNKYGYVYE